LQIAGAGGQQLVLVLIKTKELDAIHSLILFLAEKQTYPLRKRLLKNGRKTTMLSTTTSIVETQQSLLF
jgi:hypothetical protein